MVDGEGDRGERREDGGTTLSRVDGDDLTPAAADQEDPVEALCEDLQEFHVWEGKG